jgi:hypothetical protein
MTDIYAKVGQNLDIDIEVFTSSAVAVTGLVDSAFTKTLSLNGTGGQVVTGITFTETSSSNNPGVYRAQISGSTGFTAVAGSYELVITRTGTAQPPWHATIRVTSDGTGAGTWGSAAFTPVSGNGRITTGGIALAGATVRVLTSANVLYLQTVSDVNGLYPTLYFANAGTYTLSVQASGYTIGIAAITVAGSVATGPGADIVLNVSSVAGTMTAAALWSYARRQMKDRSGAKADQDIYDTVNDAMSMLSMEKNWPWFQTQARIDLVGSVVAGTVTTILDSPVVTIQGATWPTWAASGELLINGQYCPVLSLDSTTQITLQQPLQLPSASAQSYVMAQSDYPLPANCMRVDQVIYPVVWPWGNQPISWSEYQICKGLWQYSTTRPYIFSIGPNKMGFWPYPTGSLAINLIYFRQPANLVLSTDIADVDPMHYECLRRAIDFQAACRSEVIAGSREECAKAYQASVAQAKVWDKTAANRNLGMNSKGPFQPAIVRMPTING